MPTISKITTHPYPTTLVKLLFLDLHISPRQGPGFPNLILSQVLFNLISHSNLFISLLYLEIYFQTIKQLHLLLHYYHQPYIKSNTVILVTPPLSFSMELNQEPNQNDLILSTYMLAMSNLFSISLWRMSLRHTLSMCLMLFEFCHKFG